MGKVAQTIERLRVIPAGTTELLEAEEQVRETLNGLDEGTLRRVEAVMYSGRGDGSAVELRPVLTANRTSKDDVIRAIVEKLPNFDPYFERGLQRAKVGGINLDTF